MANLRVRYETVEFGETDIHLRTLRDTDEFQDDGGASLAAGVPDAMWAIFGVVWDAGRVLATVMHDHDIKDQRILEVGCGIGLASLVLNARNADITATDRHPEAERFLEANVELNDGADIPFAQTEWEQSDDTLGTFDLIIGSDLLYARDQTELLAAFVDRHANAVATVIFVDSGRGHIGRFSTQMEARGFVHSVRPAPPVAGHEIQAKVRVHRFTR